MPEPRARRLGVVRAGWREREVELARASGDDRCTWRREPVPQSTGAPRTRRSHLGYDPAESAGYLERDAADPCPVRLADNERIVFDVGNSRLVIARDGFVAAELLAGDGPLASRC